MSWNPCLDADFPDAASADSIEAVIVPRAKDIGGFEVRRALPSKQRQMVGPFIFWDQMGPAEFITGQSIDVRPHPHIGLSTVTYLFDGEIRHRDSLGVDQVIRPGEVNLMTAGRGITHSERGTEHGLAHGGKLFGMQTWLALPLAHEDMAPAFENQRADALPELHAEGKHVRLIMGSAYGERAPTTALADTLYADVSLEPGAKLPLMADHEDRGIYILNGRVSIGGMEHGAGEMLVFRPGDLIDVTALDQGARFMLLGGETMEGPRHIWWNFVASSREKIEEAKQAWKRADWTGGPFRLPVGDDQEHIPLPAPIRVV